MSIKEKKKKILAYLTKHFKTLDPTGINVERYKKLIEPMSDKEFDKFMHLVKDGKFQIHLTNPNMKNNLDMNNLLTTADNVGCKIFHRIWIHDSTMDITYLTDKEYPIFNLPIRRQSQFLEEKMAVPESDTTTDLLTGQVTSDSRASSITQPEIQALHARGLDTTLEELVRVRGGDIHAYGDFKRQLEETGEVSLEQIDPDSRTRSSVMAKVLLRGCHLDVNF